MLTVICMENLPILEQPVSSIMNLHEAFLWLIKVLKMLKITAAWLNNLLCCPWIRIVYMANLQNM